MFRSSLILLDRSVPRLLEDNMATIRPDYENFIGSLTDGRDVTVRAVAPQTEFTIDFCVGADKDADVGMRIYFNMCGDTMAFRYKKNHKWVDYKWSNKDIPFYPGVVFEVKVYSFEKRIKVVINGTDFDDFDEVIAGRFVTFLRVVGLKDAKVDVTDK